MLEIEGHYKVYRHRGKPTNPNAGMVDTMKISVRYQRMSFTEQKRVERTNCKIWQVCMASLFRVIILLWEFFKIIYLFKFIYNLKKSCTKYSIFTIRTTDQDQDIWTVKIADVCLHSEFEIAATQLTGRLHGEPIPRDHIIMRIFQNNL